MYTEGYKFRIKDMRMKRSTMFRAAHKLAKSIVDKTENYRMAMSYALKLIWKMAKDYRVRVTDSNIRHMAYELTHKPYTGPQYKDGVPDWIIDQHFNEQESQAIWNNSFNSHVKKETEKAVLIQFDTDYGYLFTWCPKSVYKGELI